MAQAETVLSDSSDNKLSAPPMGRREERIRGFQRYPRGGFTLTQRTLRASVPTNRYTFLV
nr:MAG TPA: hypothetical protein [Caudoviricetes sp.]